MDKKKVGGVSVVVASVVAIMLATGDVPQIEPIAVIRNDTVMEVYVGYPFEYVVDQWRDVARYCEFYALPIWIVTGKHNSYH